MKLGTLSKLEETCFPNIATSKKKKKNDDDIMSVNYDAIVNFSIYDQFGAIQKPDSEGLVFKYYVFINSSLLYYIKRKQN